MPTPLPRAEPSDLGLCPERTQRLVQALQAEVDRGRLPGAVVLLARHGRVALFESLGQRDPATGAATAAFAGYLRDIDWPHGGSIEIIQGEDMGSRSRLHAVIPSAPGSSIRVSGATRIIAED